MELWKLTFEIETCSISMARMEDIADIEEIANDFVKAPRNRLTDMVHLPSKFERWVGPAVGDSFIPGGYRIFVRSWGCSHNTSDSEYISGILASAGYDVKSSAEDADLWLLNSCTVKTPSEEQLRNEVMKAKELGKYLIVSGCVPQAAPNTDWLKELSVVGVHQIDRVLEVVEETLKGNVVKLLGRRKEKGGRLLPGAPLILPKIRRNPLIEILAISTGCLNRCTYCKTHQARGTLVSYDIEEIVGQAKTAFEDGVKEIWLTSEDLGAYGRDIGVTLPDLLGALVSVIPDGCMMRLGMTNPPYILDYLDEMCQVLLHPRVYSFLHIPVQSGSDRVLAAMRREYTAADFEKVVDEVTEKVPGVTVATDVICGFPGESDEDFQDTVRLVEKYRFPVLFVNQFYPRPGTPAAKMKHVDGKTVKQRTRRVYELFQAIRPYEDRIGHVYDVLVTEQASRGEYFVGHNKSYEQIMVPKNAAIMGKMVKVRITSYTKFSMGGELVDEFASSFRFTHQFLKLWRVCRTSVERVIFSLFGNENFLYSFLIIICTLIILYYFRF